MDIQNTAAVTQPAAQQQSAQFVGTDAAVRSQRRADAIAAIKGEAPQPRQAAPAPQGMPEAPEAEEEADLPVPAALRDAEGPSDEPEEKLSAVIRAREKANRLRRAAEAQRAEVERDRMRLEMERREVEQLRRARDAMQRDPLAGLKELGVDLRDLTERAATEGTPEAQFRALQEQLAKQPKELEDYRTTQAQREMAQQRSVAESQFFSMAKDEDAFPYLAARAELHPELVKSQAYALQERYYQQTGKVPTLKDIAEALDYIASEEYRAVHERQARRGTSNAAPGNAPAAGKAKTSRTLSATRAGERSATPINTATMTRDARKDLIVSMMKAGRLSG